MKILVVDDDKMILEAISYRLKAEGYEVITVDNGMDALKIFEKESLDLIITDIMMPDLSGLNLVTLLREFYSHKIPVIIISSLGKINVIYPSLKLGADDFIIKPINFQELSLSVKKYIHRAA